MQSSCSIKNIFLSLVNPINFMWVYTRNQRKYGFFVYYLLGMDKKCITFFMILQVKWICYSANRLDVFAKGNLHFYSLVVLCSHSTCVICRLVELEKYKHHDKREQRTIIILFECMKAHLSLCELNMELSGGIVLLNEA